MKSTFQIVLLVILIVTTSCSKVGKITTIDPIVAYGDIRNGFATIMDITSEADYKSKLSTIKNRLIIRCDTESRCTEHANKIASLGYDVEISGIIELWTEKRITLP